MKAIELDQARLRLFRQRAASTYDQADFLLRETGERMFSRLDYIKYQPSTILDLGAATGYFSHKLLNHYEARHIIALDNAPMLLQQVMQRQNAWKRWFRRKKLSTLCADTCQLPLPSQSVDMIWSNLSLLWHATPDQTLAECYRVLPAGGLFMFATLGPDTLKELRQAFMGIDHYQHVHDFIDMHDIGDALIHQGFSAPVMDLEYLTVTYTSLQDLFWDLKQSAMNNVGTNRCPGLMGRAAWQQMLNQYEVFRQSDELPVTYEIIYGHAWKGEPKVLTDQQTIQFYPKKKW